MKSCSTCGGFFSAGCSQASFCSTLARMLRWSSVAPFETPVVVSLNPFTEPARDKLIRRIEYAHPVFDQAAIAAQRKLPALQGLSGTWYCGAWTRYGFHEDGLMSGLAVVEALGQRIASPRHTDRVAA